MSWQPIDTAPKDGTAVLVYCPHATPFQTVAKFMRQEDPPWEGWVEIYDGEDIWPPSHWMSLPAAPIGDSDTGSQIKHGHQRYATPPADAAREGEGDGNDLSAPPAEQRQT